MHVNAKKMAVSGLLMALAVIFIILSGILDFNTLFFLAAAAFFVGIIIREFGLRYGAAYFIGCLVLGVLLAPQKLYCITYAMMGIYVLGIEFLWYYLGKHPQWAKRKLIFQIGKFVIFNMMYLPVLSIAGIATGIFVGLTGNIVVRHLKKLPQFKRGQVVKNQKGISI